MDLRRLFVRLAQKDDRLSWWNHVSMLRAFRQRQQEILAYPILSQTNAQVIAYVANFKRPQNIALIVHALLASPSVGRVIVSNNNPACDLSQWFTSPCDRVTVLQHDTPQSCAMRYEHLRHYPSPFYLIVDDDVLLLPVQIDALLIELEKDPSVPHGVYGQRWEQDHFRGGIQAETGRINVISRVYAFTEKHLSEWHRLFALLPQGNHHLAYSDDMILSHCGNALPRIHNIGSFIDCPSQGTRGIAMWRQDGFHAGREDLYRQLQQLKSLSS